MIYRRYRRRSVVDLAFGSLMGAMLAAAVAQLLTSKAALNPPETPAFRELSESEKEALR